MVGGTGTSSRFSSTPALTNSISGPEGQPDNPNNKTRTIKSSNHLTTKLLFMMKTYSVCSNRA